MSKTSDYPESRKLIIDFSSGAVDHRRRFGGGRGQDLPKAVGMKSGRNPQIVDATGGLGRDGFLLASLGAQVTMIERSDKIHLLLASALTRAKKSGSGICEIANRIKLIHGDAKELLPTLSPQIVVVDPMHPPRKTNALVKKEMRLVREIVGTDQDSVALMKIALEVARERVVLKWPRKAEPMTQIGKPSHQIIGKTTRYDVFMTTQ